MAKKFSLAEIERTEWTYSFTEEFLKEIKAKLDLTKIPISEIETSIKSQLKAKIEVKKKEIERDIEELEDQIREFDSILENL